MRFLCIDPQWDGGTPPDTLVTRTIYSGVRFAVKPDQWPVVGRYLELGLTVALVLDRDSGDPWIYADWATSDWMAPRVKWFVGNEPDGSGASSWTLTPAQYADLWQAAKVLHGERWIAGMSSGDVDAARPYLQPDATGLSVHIYTLDPSQARTRIAEYQTLKRRLWIGETHPVDGFKLADYAWGTLNVNDFCYSGAMVPEMGLYA